LLLLSSFLDMPFAWDDDQCPFPEISPNQSALALQVDFDVCEAMFKSTQEGAVTRLSSLEALSPFCSAVIVDGEQHLYPKLTETFNRSCAFSTWIMEDIRTLIEEGQNSNVLDVDNFLVLLRAAAYDFYFWFSMRWNFCRAVKRQVNGTSKEYAFTEAGVGGGGRREDEASQYHVSSLNHSILDACLRAVSQCCSLSMTHLEQSKARIEVLRFFYVLNHFDVVLDLAREAKRDGADELTTRIKFARDALPSFSDALPDDARAETYLLAKCMAKCSQMMRSVDNG